VRELRDVEFLDWRLGLCHWPERFWGDAVAATGSHRFAVSLQDEFAFGQTDWLRSPIDSVIPPVRDVGDLIAGERRWFETGRFDVLVVGCRDGIRLKPLGKFGCIADTAGYDGVAENRPRRVDSDNLDFRLRRKLRGLSFVLGDPPNPQRRGNDHRGQPQ
jgi:hypothetical protein